MAVDLGRVSLVPKGEYSASTQYERLDVVRYNGAAYLVLKDVKGVTPAAGANYMLLVEDGETGATGPQGPAGPGSSIELPLSVENGGTGQTSLTSGAVLVGNGSGAILARTIANNTSTTYAITRSADLVTMNTLSYALNRTTGPGSADTNYSTAMMRAISAGTSDLTAGTSSLTSGQIYLVYE